MSLLLYLACGDWVSGVIVVASALRRVGVSGAWTPAGAWRAATIQPPFEFPATAVHETIPDISCVPAEWSLAEPGFCIYKWGADES